MCIRDRKYETECLAAAESLSQTKAAIAASVGDHDAMKQDILAKQKELEAHKMELKEVSAQLEKSYMTSQNGNVISGAYEELPVDFDARRRLHELHHMSSTAVRSGISPMAFVDAPFDIGGAAGATEDLSLIHI